MAEARQAQRDHVLFVPGLWLHPASWQPWIEEFVQSGYDCQIVCWAEEPGRPGAGRASTTPPRADIAQYAHRLRQICESFDRRPVVIGHGLGGLLAETVLTTGHASAVISLAPPPSGAQAIRSCLRGVRRLPGLAALVAWRGPGPPPHERFVRSFAGALPAADALRVHDTWVVAARPTDVVRWLVRQRRPGRDHSHRQGAPRGPLLLACGGKDRVVLEADASDIYRRYRRLFPDSVTDLEVFPDRDHALTVDSQWLAIAFYCLDWMTAHDL